MINCDCFINGTWTKGEAGALAVRSPHDGRKLGEVSLPSPAQINQAIVAAALAQKEWAQLPIKERSRVLFQAREILLREADEITSIKGAECGKLKRKRAPAS